jgi:hypothetical protein
MGKASRSKRTRTAVHSAKRSRSNNWWYGITALVLIVGMGLLVYARRSEPPEVGPFIMDSANPANPRNKNAHWHAALGVYDCDRWLGDSGDGVWNWPYANANGGPSRAEAQNVYAGMHSHTDGIIHMEPSVSEDAGANATLGRYMRYGGWSVDEAGFEFLGTKRSNGDTCAGKPGRFQWATAAWDGTEPPGKQKFTVRTGNPSDRKLDNGEIVILAFLPEGKDIVAIGNPPSIKNLPGAENIETPPGQMPPITPTPSVPIPSVPKPSNGAPPISAAP